MVLTIYALEKLLMERKSRSQAPTESTRLHPAQPGKGVRKGFAQQTDEAEIARKGAGAIYPCRLEPGWPGNLLVHSSSPQKTGPTNK